MGVENLMCLQIDQLTSLPHRHACCGLYHVHGDHALERCSADVESGGTSCVVGHVL